MSNLEHWRLYKIFAKKCTSESMSDFKTYVKMVCEDGITLSKSIILTFPNFTLHDETHIHNVCEWMVKLLGASGVKKLTANEAAMLLMSACCHDVGMAVSKKQRKDLIQGMTEEYLPTSWAEYFNKYPQDFEKRNDKQEQDRILRNYVRVNHHKRIGEQEIWRDELDSYGIYFENLIKLCQSHGEDLGKLDDVYIEECDIKLCAVLLRLADILDFDCTRVPDVLFKHIGLDLPKNKEEEISRNEWYKNGAGHFYLDNKNRTIKYKGTFEDPNVDHLVSDYVKWVKRELDNCRKYLSGTDSARRIDIPYIENGNISREGYKGGDFCLTMEQDKVLQLLTGKNLYSDAGVFVRELLQNSIDAVHTRRGLDARFREEDGKICIRTWTDNEGYSWFRIEDNGIGMDENIITNYLLKIGKSYYTSDDFKKLKENFYDKSYTPISRFGIGILSCFMSDPNTTVAISTRRYVDSGENPPAVRMDITGLYGYYYLTDEKVSRICKPMPHPDDETDRGYRGVGEYGTTVCVRVNLYHLGNYLSFLEIVEKYVHFPDIRIEYHGDEGTKKFPTQKELMELVHKLNPDGAEAEPKIYRHPIPDDKFEELKRKCKRATFDRKPDVCFQYYPLDWLSGDENIQGVALKMSLDFFDSISSFVQVNRNDNLRSIRVEVSGGYYEENSSSVIVSYQELLNISDDEIKIWEYILKTWSNEYIRQKYDDSFTITTYNGVLADTTNLLGRFSEICFLLLLLNKVYLPEVDVAREQIISFSLKNVLNLGRLQKKLDIFDTNSHFFATKDLLVTEKELFELLKDNPNFENEIWNDIYKRDKYTLSELQKKLKSETTIRISFDENSRLYTCIFLAVLKKYFTVYYDYDPCDLYIGKKTEEDICTEEFPVGLFFSFIDNPSNLACIHTPVYMFSFDNKNHGSSKIIYYFTSYNKNHPFSQWLITHQKELMEKVPGVYNDMIKTMVEGKKATDIMNFLNKSLTFLQKYQNNHFKIDDTIFLKPEDFA